MTGQLSDAGTRCRQRFSGEPRRFPGPKLLRPYCVGMAPWARRERPRTGWWAVDADLAGQQASRDGSQRPDVPWPGHDPGTSGCSDYPVGVDIGELAPGHRLVVRGVCLDGGRLSLYYAWTPGLTEAMGEDSGVWLAVDYGADVLPRDRSAVGSYGTDGGEFSEGDISYARPPASARRVWFDFYATADDDHRACRVTIELATRRVRAEE